MGKLMRGPFLLILCFGIVLVGCRRSPNVDTGARYYQVRGIVRGIAPDRSSVDVEHEDIPGFMPSMTMPFSTRRPADIAGLRIGDAISFQMAVTDSDLFLERVRKISVNDLHLGSRTPTPTPTPMSSRLHDGDELPAFTLTNQEGAPVTNATFRGHDLVLTFIFTRCPVPNFCPRMSNNFGELQKAIQDGQISKVRLLSITLDPAFDTPQILKEYGASRHADPNVWTFATGNVDLLVQAFSVYRQTEGGTISHGLATALVNADGKIVTIWRGNGWTPAEVIQKIREEKTPPAVDQ
jgi:protein SCO1/2